MTVGLPDGGDAADLSMSPSESTLDVIRNGGNAYGVFRAPPSGPTCFAAWLSSWRQGVSVGEGEGKGGGERGREGG